MHYPQTVFTALSILVFSSLLLQLYVFVQNPQHRLRVFKAFQDTPTIPNIVHFVHLVGSEQAASLELPFRQFVAIYSAWYYLHPETIYIHTDVEEHLIEERIANTTSPYTHAVARLSGVHFKYHEPITETTEGFTIHELSVQSDFVRTEVLKRYGGIYLDNDAYVLRDLAPLRHLHYENIVGRRSDGHISPAIMLSSPRNNMMVAYHALQDRLFDIEQHAHATGLLTSLVREFQVSDYQTLILPQDAFSPLSSAHDDLIDIYSIHPESSIAAINSKPIDNLTEFIENFQINKPDTWKRDWRLSYVLNGCTRAIALNLDEEEQLEVFGQAEGITLDYVLAGRSNFALAVRPAVRHAVTSGALDDVANSSLIFGGHLQKGDELRA